MSATKVAKQKNEMASSPTSFKTPLKFDKISNSHKEEIDSLLKTFNSSMVSPRGREDLVVKIGHCYRDSQNYQELNKFICSLNDFWVSIPRARAARMFKDLLDCFRPSPFIKDEKDGKSLEKQPIEVAEMEVILCRELISWSEKDKRIFLKQSLESRLAALLIRIKKYNEAIVVINRLLSELKRLDDKLALTQTHQLECQLYFELKNMAKAKAALTAARTTANSIYCPPAIQGNLDKLAGLVHAEEGDFKTAFSYFIESVDAYSMIIENDPLYANEAASSLKFMLLCKIALNQVEEMDSFLSKTKISMNERDLAAIKAIGQAYKDKSLKIFRKALFDYSVELQSDPIISAHFDTLYDNLMIQNILRIVAPYTIIKISYLAKELDLPESLIESKLSLMILDEKLKAILDQQDKCLVITKRVDNDKIFDLGLQFIKNLDASVETLYQKTVGL